MTVQELWYPASFKDSEHLLMVAASCNQALLPDIGDPTEIALLDAAKSAGIMALPIERVVTAFSSETRLLETRHKGSQLIKGAPEKIIQLIPAQSRQEFQDQATQMMVKGLRVLGCAEKKEGYVTGDSPITAKAIAEQIGLSGEVITGTDMDSLSEAELDAITRSKSIFARILPSQ